MLVTFVIAKVVLVTVVIPTRVLSTVVFANVVLITVVPGQLLVPSPKNIYICSFFQISVFLPYLSRFQDFLPIIRTQSILFA